MNIDVNSIILAVIALLGGCAWFVNWRKDRQEAKGLKKDNQLKDMDLSKMYVDEFRENIADPLRREVRELRSKVDQLRNAIQKIDRCPHRANCPVLDGMQYEQAGDE